MDSPKSLKQGEGSETRLPTVRKILSLKQSLNPAFLKQKLERREIELFKKEFIALLSRINPKESEEFHKNLIKDFLNAVYYKDKHYINTKGKTDLVIHNGNSTASPVGVLIETKSPINKAETPSHKNLNVKSFQELVLYYLRERKTGKNFELRYLIITNIYEWFIFDAQDFEKLFYDNKTLLNRFEQFNAGNLAGTRTDFFYNEIAAPEIQKLQAEIHYRHFDIRDYDKILHDSSKNDDKKLIALYKFLSPVHLLKLPFANDNNQLNKEFYAELLHIIGLEEVKHDGRKLIVRKKSDNTGSLIETAVHQIKSDDRSILNDSQYGENREERAFNIAFDLVITWINRILFLKLLEAQILKYNGWNKDYAFLSADKLTDYGNLNDLFFSVLACKIDERESNYLKTKFANVPYLNSSLFEQTELEKNAIYIRALGNVTEFVLYPKSALHNEKHFRSPNSHLEYLLRFLDAYDFSSEGSEDIQEENKPLISASVLGLIFEKINGYKDGSFFTPSFITMYMCRETIRRAVIQKFNEIKGWNCQTVKDIYNKIEDIDEANKIFNSIRICDPSVGSGHFLVSALNEMIYLKSELGILVDKDGKKLKNYFVSVENDELIITDDEGNYFTYNPKNKESQRVQETFFHEKQTIIENCLFGVDINPNSVKICQLRLWIELLKHTYYSSGTLETLPNIDINIKCGNSLINRFDLHGDNKITHYDFLRKLQDATREYKEQVFLYKSTDDKTVKKKAREKIANIKKDFNKIYNRIDVDYKKWEQAENEYKKLYASFFHDDIREKKLEQLQKEADTLLNKYEQKIKNFYSNAFEWSFEFPEVMDEDGNFVGFDVIIGNPPYIQLQSMGKIVDAYKNMDYQVFERMGDIYCLFYECGYQLLKPQGILCFITSNKWMRAGYGEKTRKFFVENTNPELLLDFAGTKVFDEATVDVNILMFAKVKNRQKTQACIVKKDGIKNMSVYFSHNSTNCGFKADESWVILSPIEQQIKQKIEKIGIPLKDWDIQINYGIKTGFNEAFIISGEKRKELIKQDPKSDEIIRPILRGRDIKRYGYDFADLWLINTHNGIKEKGITPINVDSYPAIKKHLDKYYSELEKRQDKGDTPYNLRNCSYMDDFLRRKIIYPGLMRIAKSNLINFPRFALDLEKNFFFGNDCYFIVGKHIEYLWIILNSTLLGYLFRYYIYSFDETGYKIFTDYFQNIPIVFPNDEILNIAHKFVKGKLDIQKINTWVYSLYGFTDDEIFEIENFVNTTLENENGFQ